MFVVGERPLKKVKERLGSHTLVALAGSRLVCSTNLAHQLENSMTKKHQENMQYCGSAISGFLAGNRC